MTARTRQQLRSIGVVVLVGCTVAAVFNVVMTGELAKYGNLILKKGVTPVV